MGEYLKSPEGERAMKEYKEAINEAQKEAIGKPVDERNSPDAKKAIKAAVKSIEKDDKLKKPTSAYWMWLNDNRENIKAKLPQDHKVTDISKKGGELWKALTETDKEPWEKKAKAAKDAYDEYLSSPEGERAMKEYKEAKKEAIGKPVDEPTSPDPKTPYSKKRHRVPKS